MARRKTPRRKASRPARKVKAAARKTARKRTKSARRPKVTARKAARRTRASRASKRTKRAKPAKAVKRAQPRAKRPARRADKREASPREKPVLDRIRRLLADEERLGAAAAARQGDHLSASAVSGRGALRAELNRYTETSPTLTAGDVDARWQDAYAIGDEAPGGDNPTPDQDRVDDIGKALGIEYRDGEELKGGEEVLERDRHRWEMDPADDK